MIANKLNFGDTIGVVAPASTEDEIIINDKLNTLGQLGFKVKSGKCLYSRTGYLSGEDKARAEDLMNMFLDKSVDAVLCFRGGYGTMRMLPYINYEIIKENPKIFIGFSDITTLLNVFYKKCGLVTFHGPMANSNLKDQCTLNSMLQTLMDGITPYIIKNPEGSPLYFHNFQKPVHGRIVGGNLSLICSTVGTKYEIDTEDKILFIEDVDEPPYRLDRLLTQLILAGKFEKCRGILLGQFTGCELPHYERSFTLVQVIEDRILKMGIPTCSNFMSGHGSPKLTLPIGAKACLDPFNNFIEILEPVVK
ncbi:MAG: LD-carboxypeptidase [Bacillota bacterium]|nr:LD-carboxypeptidase [Bacillota bacterium]